MGWELLPWVLVQFALQSLFSCLPPPGSNSQFPPETEMCPANSLCLSKSAHHRKIPGHTVLELPKAVYKALWWGTTSIFSVSATNLLNPPAKMTPPSPQPGENAQERTQGEQIILALAQSPSPAVMRFQNLTLLMSDISTNLMELKAQTEG